MTEVAKLFRVEFYPGQKMTPAFWAKRFRQDPAKVLEAYNIDSKTEWSRVSGYTGEVVSELGEVIVYLAPNADGTFPALRCGDGVWTQVTVCGHDPLQTNAYVAVVGHSV